MPPKPLFDLATIDLGATAYSLDAIRAINPQRYEFEQLTSIVHLDIDEGVIVGLREVTEDEFWIRGHIPGRPLFPGVLLVEAAAQLCSFYSHTVVGDGGFYGFGGIDSVRFRGTVTPPCRLYLVARPEVLTKKRSRFVVQGIVDERIVFEGRIIGLQVPMR